MLLPELRSRGMEDIYVSGGPREIPLEELYAEGGKQPPERKPAPGKKKKHRFRTFLKTAAAIILIIFIIFTALAAASGYTKQNLKSNRYISKTSLNNNALITNILLIGVDDSSEGTSRSDSMILVSLDFIHGKIKLTSLLRDCYLEIPGKNNAKLNAAYSYGGAQLLCDTIEYNFKVDIDHYIKVDFGMFTKLIDSIGGIDIEVTEKEAKFINRTSRQNINYGSSVHLNGEETLVYCRIRKLDTDYMRSFRQRKVISAIINKVNSTSPVETLRAVWNVLPLLETDMSAPEITLNAFRGGICALLFKISQIRIPDDDLMTTGYAGNQWVERPDMEGCIKRLEDFIYSGTEPEN